MKNGKKPTRKQKIAMQAVGLNPEYWLVVRVITTNKTLEIVHRHTDKVKRIPA